MDTLPQLTVNQTDSIFKYLRLTDSLKKFSTEILKILIKDRRVVHRERINDHRNIVSFVARDIVMARWEVQNYKSLAKVGKICYQVRGSFTNDKPIGHGSCMAYRFGKLTSHQLKFMLEKLSTLQSNF